MKIAETVILPEKVVLDLVSWKTQGQVVSATKSRLTWLNGTVAFRKKYKHWSEWCTKGTTKMRETLFRGKRASDGAWVQGDLVRIVDGDKTTPYIYYQGEVIPETVGQFTGIYDSNGSKIFEGDVLVFDGAEDPQNEKAEVVFDDGRFKLKYFNFPYMDDLDANTASFQSIVGIKQ